MFPRQYVLAGSEKHERMAGRQLFKGMHTWEREARGVRELADTTSYLRNKLFTAVSRRRRRKATRGI